MKECANEQVRLNQIIGRNIKFYREVYNLKNRDKEKMTQALLAKKVGVSTPLIGSLESENSSQGISVYNLYKISKVLEVPVEKFYETPVVVQIGEDLKITS